MDRIKNVTGLVEWYGRSVKLRDEANLLIAAGHIDPEDSDDEEERSQIKRMHELMDEYELDGAGSLAGKTGRQRAQQRGLPLRCR